MTEKIINLNKARKARTKQNKKAMADENSVKFGRNKATKLRELDAAERAHAFLDGHKRDGEK